MAGNGLGYHSHNESPVILEISMNQYDALMQRLDRLQTAFDRLLERETDKAKFMAEVNFRVQAVEKQLGEHVKYKQEQQEQTEQFQKAVQDSLAMLKEQTNTRITQLSDNTKAMEWQYKGASKLGTAIFIGIAALWSVVQAIVWTYDKITGVHP